MSTALRQSGNYDLSRMLSSGIPMNSSIMEKLQPSFANKDNEFYKSDSDVSVAHTGQSELDAKSIDPIWDLNITKEDEEIL